MQFRCPSCGVTGRVRVPDHYPRGKTVRIRCTSCNKPFPLSLGKLFPQEFAESYRALIPEALPCRGDMVGSLWVETVGPPTDHTPVIVLPAHPSFSHALMHDLMDPFYDYFRVCYLEFPGSPRNSSPVEKKEYGSMLVESLEPLQKHLNAERFHLLAHLSCSMIALQAAASRPQALASLILVEPDLCLQSRLHRQKKKDSIRRLNHGPLEEINGEKLLVSLIEDVWGSNFEERHLNGLARILEPGFSVEAFRRDALRSHGRLTYSKLVDRQLPTLIYSSRDGNEEARRDALFLQASLPSAQTVTLEKGGAWAAWFGGTFFTNKMLAFKRTAQKRGQLETDKRSKAFNGQSLGWMLALFILLAGGLSGALDFLRFQPDFMRLVIPPILASLLPVLWFIVPKKINTLRFLRFQGFSTRTILLPVAGGALTGLFYRGCVLTLSQGLSGQSLARIIPATLISLPLGARGRLILLVAVAFVALFVFGVAENLWVLRRSRAQILVPTLLFTLLPPSFPDMLWRLPLGFMAAVLFSRNLSILSPLLLVAGFAAASETSIPLDRLPIAWQGYPGVAVTMTLLTAAVLLTVFIGTEGKIVKPEVMYYTDSINREARLLRWETGLGIVTIVFSLIAAGAFIFGFLSV
jgi:pimeloyl-ACP methyl ester carboxylesterase